MSWLLHGGRVRRAATDLGRGGVMPISEHPRRRYRPDFDLGRHGELPLLREKNLLLIGDGGASGLGDGLL